MPADQLDQEHEYWRTFYSEVVDPVVRKKQLRDFRNTRPLPWPLIDALFCARKKDPAGVKRAFEALAGEIPQSETFIWGGDKYRPDRVPLLLSLAGASDSATWRPLARAREAIKVELDQMDAFMGSIKGSGAPPWRLEAAPECPLTRMEVAPTGGAGVLRDDWNLSRVTSLFTINEIVWVITEPRFFGTPRSKYTLFCGRLAEDGRALRFEPREVPWPAPVAGQEGLPKYMTSLVVPGGDKPTVWIGTELHGLARFDLADGQWTSKWYTQHDGFPCNSIHRIAEGRNHALLLYGEVSVIRTNPDGGKLVALDRHNWVLNTSSGEVALASQPPISGGRKAESWPAGQRKQYQVFPLSGTQHLFGRVWWARQSSYTTLSGQAPAFTSEWSTQSRGVTWIAFRVSDTMHEARWIVGYRPAPAGAEDWAAEDQWIGPFSVPGNWPITCMGPYDEKRLLLTTKEGMYLVDCDKATKLAQTEGHIRSTRQWREGYEKRLEEAGWKSLLPVLLDSRRWDEAQALLDKQQPATAQQRLELALWKAHLLAKSGQLLDAAGMYGSTATDAAGQKNHPAEVFARMNQVIILWKAERFQEMLDLCEVVNERFPQTAPELGDQLNDYIKYARKRLAERSRAAPRPAANMGED